MLMARYEERPLGAGVPIIARPTLVALFSCVILVAVASAALFRRLPRRPAERPQEFERACYPGSPSPMKYARLEAGGASPGPQSVLFHHDASPVSTLEDTIEDTMGTPSRPLQPVCVQVRSEQIAIGWE